MVRDRHKIEPRRFGALRKRHQVVRPVFLTRQGVPKLRLRLRHWRSQRDLRAVARPPLRPAALCCAVVPPCRRSPPEPDFFPPWLDAFGEFAIFAARSFDIPFSFRASYCFLFFTWAVLAGMADPFSRVLLRGIR